jgi:hypothetical protein
MVRIFLPSLADDLVDRGYAIEQAWRRRMVVDNGDAGQLADIRLPDYAARLRKGNLPVAVFNATLVESGQRFLISPIIAGPRPAAPHASAAQEFAALYPQANLPLSTAVRLSATFPYVSPICRPFPDVPDAPAYHVADGGYADNDGITTAIDWISRLITHFNDPSQRPFDRIVLVRIQPFPTDVPPPPPATNRGWLYAMFGPLQTIAKVRVASQSERGSLELDLLQTADPDSQDGSSVELVSVLFSFETPMIDGKPNTDLIPLSWKLTPTQRRAIGKAWETIGDANADPENPLHVLDRYFGE